MMLVFLFFLTLCSSYARSYNILGLFPYPGRSHYRVFDPLMVELANRGHNVTVYNTFPKPYSIPNYQEVDISNCFSLPNLTTVEYMKSTSVHAFRTVHVFFEFAPTYEELSTCQQLKELWNTNNQYDVMITESFNTDYFFLFADKLGIPCIAFHTNAPFPWHSIMIGLPDNPSYVPIVFIDYGYFVSMTFFQRIENTLVYLYSLFVSEYGNKRVYDDMAKKIFQQPVPSMDEVVQKVSMLFLYSHWSFTASRPLIPNVVEVGGLNIKSNKPLPQNIEKFINESQHGVVYFCMGSLLRGETFPEEKRNAFLYAFSKIPQRVLWKWEGEVLPGKSDNIMISKWMPQRDILAHPNVKLFISHGGLLGTSEAVYEGVPVLGIPIFGDQRTNIKSLEANGAGELLDYNEITKDVVLEKIQRLLNDPKYKENAKQLSARYRDRPMSPLDTAVYWTEYVIRHKGAPHLRTAAADMPWYQYLLLDVIAFLILVTVSALAILYYSIKLTLRFLCNLICGKKSSSKPATGKKVKRN